MIWLIGEQNPYGATQDMALFPLPPRAAGGRLAAILGLTRTEYLRRFVRRNLLGGGPWMVRAARIRAEEVAEESGDAPLVLLGARVSAAFGVPFRYIDGWRREGCCGRARALITIPHPSGRCRLWNGPGVAELVRDAVMNPPASR